LSRLFLHPGNAHRLGIEDQLFSSQITLIHVDFVMFYDVFWQKGQRPRLIRNIPARNQSAFASAQRLILRFIASARAFLFDISSRVGLPPLLALRFLHSWFPALNPIANIDPFASEYLPRQQPCYP
jgi:hypothetical protein